jgi:hypothetical protein
MRKPDTYFDVGDWHFSAVRDVCSNVGDWRISGRVMLTYMVFAGERCSPIPTSIATAPGSKQ